MTISDIIPTFQALLRHAECNYCTHEETHRAGSIWEICDSCGMKWADDEGGKPTDAHDYPIEILNAQNALDKMQKSRSNANGLDYIAALKAQRKILAQSRDDLCNILGEVEGQYQNVDEAIESLDECVDKLSELV